MCENQICPSCESDQVVPILYGYPGDETIEMSVRGEVKLGGCCIEKYQPQLHCNNCDNNFGGEEMPTEEKLLLDVKKLMYEQNKILKASGGYMNIFEIVHSERYEVRTHSNMIYYLLNPYSEHCMSDIYLKLFIKNIGFPDLVNEHWKTVEREKVFSDGRIDFVLECEKMCIAIEMKIDAQDQLEQLKRYEDYCKEKTSQIRPIGKKPICEDYRICYLTLDEHEPSAQSIKGVNEDKLKKLSFREHILNWLKDCIANTDKKMQAYSALKQYSILVKKLVKEESEDLKVVELLMDKENYMALQKLKEVEKEAKQKLFSEFCTALLKELPKGFELYKDDDDNAFCMPEELFNSINNTLCLCCLTDKKYIDKKDNEYSLEIILEISNRNGGALKIGYALLDKKNDKYLKYPKNSTLIFEYFGLQNDEFDRLTDGYFLCWDYLLTRNDDYYWFKELSDSVINMFDDVGLMNEVNHIVSVVKIYLSKVGVENYAKK